MIKSFRHKGLRRFFETGDVRGIGPQLATKLARQLTVLNACDGPEGMNLPATGCMP
jgi:toxin HigB-1